MTNLVKKAILLLTVALTQTLSAQTMADGLAAMQMEDWDKAISIYTGLGQNNNQQALLALGSAHLAKNDAAKALESFKKAFDANPDGAYAFISLGRQALLANNAEEIERQFARAAKAGKKDVDALRAIGESYLYGPSRNLARAEELLKNAYTFKTKDFPTLMQLGYCYKEVPNGGLAVQHYEFAEAASPNNPLALYMKARVYKQAKLYDQYKDALEATIASDGGFTQALRGLAEYWYFNKKNYKEALAAYEALKANGREPKIEDDIQLANCYFLMKKYKECTEAVDRVMAKDGSKNYLRRLQGYCLYETDQAPKALEVLTEYFKNAPADKIQASDYEYIAKARVKVRGDTAMAIAEYRKALALDPSVWKDYKDIGSLLQGQKKFCEALPAYQTYADSLVQSGGKTEAMDFFSLGTCQYYCREDSMRYQKAFASYQKVTEMMPAAAIGWLWTGKAGAKLDPDMTTETDNAEAYPKKIEAFGKAYPYFEKYVSIAWANKDKNKKNLVDALTYMAYANYLKGKVAEYQQVSAQLLELDPANETGLGLQKEFNENGNTIKPWTPTVPTAPKSPAAPNGGGGGGPKN